jgi:glycosyltransferase involved in cell wall biosynthesis
VRRGFTFAVIGHNEAERLHVALASALAAAGPADTVWFVDSGSDDDSVVRATELGAEGVKAPRGKGAAIASAWEQCETEYIAFLDGDMQSSSRNFFDALCAGVEATGADLVVGVYTEPVRRWAVTPGIYLPLVDALFADAHERGGIEIPLSGLRAWRTSIDVGALPNGYGVETHLNLVAALAGYRIANWELGEFVGPLRGFANLPGMGREIGAAILDLAERHDRLSHAARPAWDEWVENVVAVIATMPPPDGDFSEYRERLAVAAARPLPPR